MTKHISGDIILIIIKCDDKDSSLCNSGYREGVSWLEVFLIAAEVNTTFEQWQKGREP